MPSRHSPSTAIATCPVWNGFLAPNSSPKVLRYFSSLPNPPSAPIRPFWKVNILVNAAFLAVCDLPWASK